MDILNLCEKINLQPVIKKQVEDFINHFDFTQIDEIQKGYLNYEDMQKTLTQVQAILGTDENGIKILACQLKAACENYQVYKERLIPDNIYFDTMKCFTRFINEAEQITKKVCFNLCWWATRQAGCHLFRLGELEYEAVLKENKLSVYIHIPSDARLNKEFVDASLEQAFAFFKTQYPQIKTTDFYCHSWLLDNQLKMFLGEASNIISFQNRFVVLEEGQADPCLNKWLFNTESTDYSAFCENTSLQKKVKNHLINGGIIKSVLGRLK